MAKILDEEKLEIEAEIVRNICTVLTIASCKLQFIAEGASGWIKPYTKKEADGVLTGLVASLIDIAADLKDREADLKVCLRLMSLTKDENGNREIKEEILC